MAEQSVELHAVVKDIASRLKLEGGRVVMTDGDLARNRAKLLEVRTEGEKKEVLLSLVALVSRLVRESKEGTEQAVSRLTDLAAGLLGDPEKAKALFSRTGQAASGGNKS